MSAAIRVTTFRAMHDDRDRCANCHAPMVDHYNGQCAPDCGECGCVGTAGNPMEPSQHERTCSMASQPTQEAEHWADWLILRAMEVRS